jgi:predicted nucleic-acid-binding protein
LIAIDTNIVVRIVANDEAEQVARASAALAEGDIYLSLTVCLEAAWVLSSIYKKPRAVVADGLTAFAGIPTITIENPEALAMALDWYRQGMDFADALHLAVAADLDCTSMLSFDNHFTKSAARLGTIPVHQP